MLSIRRADSLLRQHKRMQQMNELTKPDRGVSFRYKTVVKQYISPITKRESWTSTLEREPHQRRGIANISTSAQPRLKQRDNLQHRSIEIFATAIITNRLTPYGAALPGRWPEFLPGTTPKAGDMRQFRHDNWRDRGKPQYYYRRYRMVNLIGNTIIKEHYPLLRRLRPAKWLARSP